MLPESDLTKIIKHAESCYPEECCGFITGAAAQRQDFEVVQCKNVQNQFHQQDPENFPRTARNAYMIDPSQLLRMQKSLRESNRRLYAIYHSHIDADAFFSEEDRRLAIETGEPLYPGVLYIVVSVYQGQYRAHSYYAWNPDIKNYERIIF